jgi:hypothetical protein
LKDRQSRILFACLSHALSTLDRSDYPLRTGFSYDEAAAAGRELEALLQARDNDVAAWAQRGLIRTNPATIARGESGTITGSLYLATPDGCFPERDWNDFVVDLLLEWLSTLHGIASLQGSSGVLAFRDGPYALRLSGVAQGRTHCRGLESDKVIFASTVDAAMLYRDAQSAAKIVGDICAAKGWRSDPLDWLRRLAAHKP